MLFSVTVIHVNQMGFSFKLFVFLVQLNFSIFKVVTFQTAGHLAVFAV